MAFRNLTNVGKEYLATRLANELPVKFIKAKIGNGGVPLLVNPADTKDLYNFKKEVTIIEAVQEQNSIRLTLQVTNSEILEGFYLKEIGIYVDDNGKEVLYWYCNEDNSQYINAQTDVPLSFEIDIMMEVTNINSTVIEWAGKENWISKNYFDEKVRTFEIPTIAEIQSRKNLKVGDIVEVLGYYSAGDGAGHKRIIANKDDGSGVQLKNGLWANIVHNGKIDIEWLGAKGNGIDNDTQAFVKANKIGSINTIHLNKNYFTNGIEINNKTIYSNKAIIKGTITLSNSKFIGNICNLLNTLILLNNNVVNISQINPPNLTALKIEGDNNNIFGIKFNYCQDASNSICILNAGNNNTISNCIFPNGRLYGVKTTGDNVIISDCLFETQTEVGVNYSGIKISSKENGTIPENIIIKNCFFYESEGDNIDCFIGCKKVIIKDNFFKNDGTNIEIKTFDHSRPEGSNNVNTIPENIKISNNTFNNGIVSVKAYTNNTSACNIYPKNIVVENNVFYSEPNNPSIICGTVDCIIRNNIFHLAKNSSAVRLDSMAKNVVFSRNTVKGIDNAYVLEHNQTDLRQNPSVYFYNNKIDCFRIYHDALKTLTFFSKNNYYKISDNSAYYGKNFYSDNDEFEVSNYIFRALDNSEYIILRNVVIKSPSTPVIYLDKYNVTDVLLKGIAKKSHTILGSATNSNIAFDIITGTSSLSSQVSQLNTLYHLEKMKQEGVYNDYITYMDEKTVYDKQQEKLEKEKQLSYEQALKENPNLSYEEFMSLQPMTLNLVEEPQPSARLQEFMDKYL